MTARPNMLSVKDVAGIVGLSRMTIYRLIERGDLRAYQMGRSIRVDRRDLNEYVRSCTVSWEFNSGGES